MPFVEKIIGESWIEELSISTVGNMISKMISCRNIDEIVENFVIKTTPMKTAIVPLS